MEKTIQSVEHQGMTAAEYPALSLRDAVLLMNICPPDKFDDSNVEQIFTHTQTLENIREMFLKHGLKPSLKNAISETHFIMNVRNILLREYTHIYESAPRLEEGKFSHETQKWVSRYPSGDAYYDAVDTWVAEHQVEFGARLKIPASGLSK